MVSKKMILVGLMFFTILLFSSCSSEKNIKSGKEIVLRLEPKDGNPRNSEGDFIQLKDERILFIYTHFTKGSGDNAGAYLAGRYSEDEGKTWTSEDITILDNEGGMNIMSVSLLRLSDDRIALFYLRKNSESDCIPYMRTSDDEAKSWSEPTRCISDSGYFVVNNDRIVKLTSGRIIIPASLHKTPTTETNKIGTIRCYYSDNEGETWKRGMDVSNPENATTQEPGIVELKDGKLILFCRTESGTQYVSHSTDQGESWSNLEASNITSPLSPASIERIPSTGDLLLVWNNNYKAIKDGGKRTPFNLAISKDEGVTWENIKTIEGDPNGWYCYTAIEFIGNDVLLGHCAGDRSKNIGLATTQITRLDLDWIYSEATSIPIVKRDSSGIVELSCMDKEAKIFYSLDRKIPNILYGSPIRVSRTTPLWAQAVTEGKSKSELLTTYVGTKILQPAFDQHTKSGRGLWYKYFEGVVYNVSEIQKLKIRSNGITKDVNLENREQDTSFAFIFNGYISIPIDGEYTFYLASNDGSQLIIDDYELINNDGPHSMYEESASISLQKGFHQIELKYFQMLGGLGLKLYWKGPNFAKKEISENYFTH